MKLTGECEGEFIEWYLNNHCKDLTRKALIKLELKLFNSTHDSMKYGVLVDYFDSVDYKVYVAYNEVAHKWNWYIDFKPIRNDCSGYPEFELPEARTAAIEKANYLRNEQLKENKQ